MNVALAESPSEEKVGEQHSDPLVIVVQKVAGQATNAILSCTSGQQGEGWGGEAVGSMVLYSRVLSDFKRFREEYMIITQEMIKLGAVV